MRRFGWSGQPYNVIAGDIKLSVHQSSRWIREPSFRMNSIIITAADYLSSSSTAKLHIRVRVNAES